MEIQCYIFSGIPGAYDIYGRWLVKGQRKTLGIWWNVSRTVSGEIKQKVDYQFPNDIWRRGDVNESVSSFFTNKWEGDVFIAGGLVVDPPLLHFGAYDCWGDTPAPPTLNFECNIGLF